MRNAYLLSTGAGMISGMAVVAALTGVPGFALLAGMFAALPIFIVGLAWSWAAALLAGAIASLYVHHFGPAGESLDFVTRFVAPAVLATSLANVRLPPSPTDATTARWLSPGTILVTLALAAGLSALWFLSERYAEDWAQLRETMIKFSQPPQGTDPAEAEKAQKLVLALWDSLLPAFVAASTLLNWVLNLWLAGRITLALGLLARPWVDLSLLTFPPGSGLILAAALTGASATGTVGVAATGLSGSFFFSYLLLGLAVIHHLTRGKAWRGFALSVVYFALVVLHFFLAVPIVILGLIDSIFSLRRRAPRGGT